MTHPFDKSNVILWNRTRVAREAGGAGLWPDQKGFFMKKIVRLIHVALQLVLLANMIRGLVNNKR